MPATLANTISTSTPPDSSTQGAPPAEPANNTKLRHALTAATRSTSRCGLQRHSSMRTLKDANLHRRQRVTHSQFQPPACAPTGAWISSKELPGRCSDSWRYHRHRPGHELPDRYDKQRSVDF